MKKVDGNKFAQHLEILKMKLVHDDDFFEIKNYFFDHLAESDEFMEMGKHKRDKRLEQVLAFAAQQALNTKIVALQNVFFINLRKQHFTHGGGQMNEYLANFIYFSDIDVGLLTLAPFPPARGETKMARFSLHLVDQKPKPSPN